MNKKICLVFLAIFCLTSFTSSLDGRARVAAAGDFPEGLFAKTAGYLPGDTILVSNILTGKAIDVLVVGSLDASEGVAILLSNEAAEALGIKDDTNVAVKMTKRSGTLDEAVSGKAVLAKGDEDKAGELNGDDNANETDGTEEVKNAESRNKAESARDEKTVTVIEENEADKNEISEAGEANTDEAVANECETADEKKADAVVEAAQEKDASGEKPKSYEQVENEIADLRESAENEIQNEQVSKTADNDAEKKDTVFVPSDKVVVVELPADKKDHEKVSEKIEQETDDANDAANIEDEPPVEAVQEKNVSGEKSKSYEQVETEIADLRESARNKIQNEQVPEIADEPVPEKIQDCITDKNIQNETVLDEVEEIAAAEGVPEEKAVTNETAENETVLPPGTVCENESGENAPYEAIVLNDDESEHETAEKNCKAETKNVQEAEDSKTEPQKSAEAHIAESKKSAADESIVSGKANMQKGNYVQIAAYKVIQNAREALEKYKAQYPMVVLEEKKGLNNVLVGPLALDECGAVLERFKAYGFIDAFIRNIR